MAVKLSVVPAPTESYLGKLGGDVDVVEFTLVSNTSAYADNDVLSVPALTGTQLARVAGGCFEIVSASLHDAADQGTEVYLFFTTNSGSVGTINEALNPTDAIADDIQGFLAFATYEDLINSQVSNLKAVGLILQCDASLTDMYTFAVVRSGTPTYAVDSLKVKLGIRRF